MERVAMIFWLAPIGTFGLALSAAWYADYPAAGRWLLVAAGLAAVGYGVRRAWRAYRARGTVADHFFHFLALNHESVREGTAIFRDVRITPETELVRFTTVVSVGVMTFRTPSRFYIRGVESTGWANAAYTTATLLLGWWGFPWGLVYTPVALYRNLTGGERMTVDQVLAHAELGDREKRDAMQRA